jgi:hypothetical protein
MKKVVLIILAVFLMAGVSQAKFNFGIKIGYNASKLSTSLDSIKESFASGFHVGVFVRIGGRLYLQPEAYYTLQGCTFQNDVAGTVNDWKQKVNVGTLDVPVLVGFKIINGDFINWRIFAGPEVSFVVNSKIKDVSLTGPITSSDLNTVNWYIQAGTGVDLWFLSLDLRYQMGLNDMIKTATSGSSTYSLNATNNMFVVSLGFKF